MKILIIGGTGLISTPITEQFLARGDEVWHFNRGRRESNVPAGVHQIFGDRTDFDTFGSTLTALQQTTRFDTVIDMVCYHAAEVESLGRTFAGRISHMIVCSTIDVYAKPAGRYPIRETESHKPPPWDYALEKEVCEQRLARLHEHGAFPLTIIRPAHTYNDGGALLHTFGSSTTYLDRLKRGKPIIVHGDGNSLWGSCRAEDIASSFVVAAGKPSTFGKSYHVTSDEWMTWNRIHEIVADAIGGPAPTSIHIPTDLLGRIARRAFISDVNFQFNNIFDNAAAAEDLDFRTTIPFAEGARRVVSWLDRNGKIRDSDDDPYDDQVIEAWNRFSGEFANSLRDLEPA